jgi:hypothetical protein
MTTSPKWARPSNTGTPPLARRTGTSDLSRAQTVRRDGAVHRFEIGAAGTLIERSVMPLPVSISVSSHAPPATRRRISWIGPTTLLNYTRLRSLRCLSLVIG